jgi:hypothetical protein
VPRQDGYGRGAWVRFRSLESLYAPPDGDGELLEPAAAGAGDPLRYGVRPRIGLVFTVQVAAGSNCPWKVKRTIVEHIAVRKCAEVTLSLLPVLLQAGFHRESRSRSVPRPAVARLPPGGRGLRHVIQPVSRDDRNDRSGAWRGHAA